MSVAQTAVVTAFLERADGRVLVLRRRADARTYPGRWSGVSGYLESDETLTRACVEVVEETGLSGDDVEFAAAGEPLVAAGEDGARWLVHPFLFRCRAPERISLNEENEGAVWVDPSALRNLETVPALEKAYAHVKLAERVERIEEDRAHGASWLAEEALDALIAAAELGEDPLEVGRQLVRARPSIGAIAGAVARVLGAAQTPEQVVGEARGLLAGRERARRGIAVLLGDQLRGAVVMTHSASATVRTALLLTPPDRVVCTVSEPIGEGRPFADNLRGQGLAVDVVADDDAAHAVDTVGLVLVGADTVFRDGSLANKTGTMSLAEAAQAAVVPFVVASELIKLAPFGPRAPDEELFDVTPPELIRAFVTEEGLFEPDEIASLVDRTSFLRNGYALLAGDEPEP
jgi:translation initiation factor 2B subunit (eIF-2B alpha/beta/delta family)/8-oxo-dGTP pyrophosphatase MutT (NUDIX family)